MSNQSYAPADDSLSAMRNRLEIYTNAEGAFAQGQGRQTRRVNDAPERGPEAEMTEHLREQVFNARLEATEARMDARVASAVGRIDSLAAQLGANEANMGRLSERALAASERAAAASEQAAAAAQRAAAAATEAGGLKQTMWLTSITTILSVLGIALAVYFGTQASNMSIVGSTISAFEAGRDAGSPKQPTAETSKTPAK